MIRNTYIKVFVILFLGISLTACSGLQSRNQQLGTGLGTLAGAGAGYGIGRAVGGRDGGLIGALVGALAGAVVGNTIASYLDERDRQIAALATQQALNSPASPGRTPTVSWNSDHNRGVGGQTTVIDAGYDTAGRECRKTREVAYVGGRELMDEGMFCRDPNGSGWMRVAG